MGVTLISIDDIKDYERICIEENWNDSENKDNKMHSIHAYPAKFPAFIATKAFSYAKDEGVKINKVADIFCGCGTVALEAKLHGLDFWGCDLNPVATLIAKTKSAEYKIDQLRKYYNLLSDAMSSVTADSDIYKNADNRLKYWFTETSYLDLLCIKNTIKTIIPEEKYRDAFMCIFSSILKASSRWLTKSIKPQVDPNKKETNVLALFNRQYSNFLKAVDETTCNVRAEINIEHKNFLTATDIPKVDLLITSPPYVTSYEYADLHQLSSLWLDYTDDYRSLRKGSIGSIYHSEKFSFYTNDLNITGQEIVKNLAENRNTTPKVNAIARYYTDIQYAIKKCANMVNQNGMIFLIVGDTEYKKVKIENSKHLLECLVNNGFEDIKLAKRRISGKMLTPFRDSSGRFSKDKTQRTVYHEEYIISGRKRVIE